VAAADAPDRKDAEKNRKGGARPSAEKAPRPEQTPAAGPHARPDLSNPEATPGAGALQKPGARDDMDSTG